MKKLSLHPLQAATNGDWLAYLKTADGLYVCLRIDGAASEKRAKRIFERVAGIA